MEDEAVSQFTSITGASAHTARSYLDRAQGDLEEAVEAFYADGGKEVPAAAPAGGPPAAPAAGPARPAGQPARRVPSGNIRGFADLGGDEEESEEEEDEDNEYYAGGAKSGVAVRGGPREGNRDRVADLFDEARRAGAEEGRPEDMGRSGDGFRAFSGGAHTLAGGPAPAAAAAQRQRAQQEHRRVTISFYRNEVFTVNDGEPRSVTDPENFPFMNAIMQGRCPPELDPGDPNVTIDVNLVRKDEDYGAPAKPKVVAFAGAGRKLGGDDSASTSAAAAAAPEPPPTLGGPPQVTWEGADESQPTTSIQLRLADGSRMVAKFNLTHTVADIRRFIHASRPELGSSYKLVTAFPAQQLDDDSATIGGAGLANSVIIQKA